MYAAALPCHGANEQPQLANRAPPPHCQGSLGHKTSLEHKRCTTSKPAATEKELGLERGRATPGHQWDNAEKMKRNTGTPATRTPRAQPEQRLEQCEQHIVQRNLGDQDTEIPPGYCPRRHHSTTGTPPGQHGDSGAARAPISRLDGIGNHTARNHQ